jgi:polysaccharide biosynthesis protein PslE
MNMAQRDEHINKPFDTWAVFTSILTHRRKAIVIILAAALVSVYIVLQITRDLYATDASLLIKLGRENVEVPITAQSGMVTTVGVRKEEINSEVQLLKSQSLIEQVVDKLGADSLSRISPRVPGSTSSLRHRVEGAFGLGKKLILWLMEALNLTSKMDARQKAILGMMKSMTVEPVRDSDVITIHYENADPDLCLKVVDTMLHFYFEHHTRARRNTAAKSFYAEQMQHDLDQLLDIEEERNRMKSEWNIYSVADQRSLLLKELMELQTQIDIHASERAMYQKQKEVMSARMAQMPDSVDQSKTVGPNPALLQLKDRIANLHVEKARLSSRFAPKSQTMSDIEEQISSLTQLLKEEEATQTASHVSEANPLKREFEQSVGQLDVKIAGLDAKIKEIQAPVAEIKGALKRLNSGEELLEKATRQRNLSEEIYVASAKRFEEARISNALDENRVANVVVLSPPMRQVAPVSPRRLLIIALAIPAGLLLAIGYVLLVHYVHGDDSSPVAHGQTENSNVPLNEAANHGGFSPACGEDTPDGKSSHTSGSIDDRCPALTQNTEQSKERR